MKPETAAKLSGALDRAFGEALTLTARKQQAGDVNLPLQSDATRPDQALTGVFTDPSDAARLLARGRADDTVQPRTTSEPIACIATASFVWTPRTGDLLTRVETGEVYQIAKVHRDGFGRTYLYLTGKRAP